MAELPYRYTVGPQLGEGAHRYVIATNWHGKDAVVKRPRNPDRLYYLSMMRSEIENWLKVKDTPLAKHFAQVYDWDHDNYTWTIMERLPKVFGHLRWEEADSIRPKVESTKQIISRVLQLRDLHEFNIGIRESGEVAIIDYAF